LKFVVFFHFQPKIALQVYREESHTSGSDSGTVCTSPKPLCRGLELIDKDSEPAHSRLYPVSTRAKPVWKGNALVRRSPGGVDRGCGTCLEKPTACLDWLRAFLEKQKVYSKSFGGICDSKILILQSQERLSPQAEVEALLIQGLYIGEPPGSNIPGVPSFVMLSGVRSVSCGSRCTPLLCRWASASSICWDRRSRGHQAG